MTADVTAQMINMLGGTTIRETPALCLIPRPIRDQVLGLYNVHAIIKGAVHAEAGTGTAAIAGLGFTKVMADCLNTVVVQAALRTALAAGCVFASQTAYSPYLVLALFGLASVPATLLAMGGVGAKFCAEGIISSIAQGSITGLGSALGIGAGAFLLLELHDIVPLGMFEGVATEQPIAKTAALLTNGIAKLVLSSSKKTN